MPNWCCNDLIINGEKKEVDKVLASIKSNRKHGTILDFNKIVPMPQELLGMTSPAPNKEKEKQKKLVKKYGAGNWYDWAHKNWGTKWNCSDETSEVSTSADGAKIISFDTAWAPPVPVIAVLAGKFPNVNFVLSYFEPGCQFVGKLDVLGEKYLHEQYGGDDKGYKELAEQLGYETEFPEDEEEK